jgi:hypothetical protein
MSERPLEGFCRSRPVDETGQLRRIALQGSTPYHCRPVGAHVHRGLGSLGGEPDAVKTKVTQ